MKSSTKQDTYGKLVAISTIVAVTAAAMALIVRMMSRNQRAVDEATSWIKRIVVTWIVLNSLGFIVAWYAMGQNAEAPAFETGEAAAAYNRAAFQSFMPGYEAQIATVDGAHRTDGQFEARHEDGSGTMFYDTTRFAAPRVEHKVYTDRSCGRWWWRRCATRRRPRRLPNRSPGCRRSKHRGRNSNSFS